MSWSLATRLPTIAWAGDIRLRLRWSRAKAVSTKLVKRKMRVIRINLFEIDGTLIVLRKQTQGHVALRAHIHNIHQNFRYLLVPIAASIARNRASNSAFRASNPSIRFCCALIASTATGTTRP